ncbi:MAG: Gfo/Idh/MocA family oxidoreductase [Bryobacterales bacterium]|nr:Gfo/Idh/MocA family oxidoreductase [Bryobacterales bacterium]
MHKIKTAVLGTGFMGRVHTEAIRRLGNVEVVALAASPAREARALANMFDVHYVTGDWEQIVHHDDVEAVHICTPNALHYPMAMAALKAGKHVLCEKPLAMSIGEAQEMLDYAETHNLVHATNHNLRYYPVVQHIRQIVARGDLGDILIVQGTYSQDWLLYQTDFNWRILAEHNGAARVVGDIGSHWMDMIQHLTGLPITSLCADTMIFHKTRKQPKTAIETFAGKTLAPEDYDEVTIDTEDFASVLVRLGDRCRGAYTVSQMSAGNKNRFEFEIYGTKGGVRWNQERPDELWLGFRNEPNRIIIKDPSLLAGPAAGFADLPGGHSEGYDDSHKQLFRRFYRRVVDPSQPVDYPTFEDGLRGMKLIAKVLESSANRCWVDCN